MGSTPQNGWRLQQAGKNVSKPPYDPRAVANLLLDMADANYLRISNLALQKWLYFAHGHFLAQTHGPLVSGAFEAWRYGPVHPAVYRAFKGEGGNPLRSRAAGRNVMTGECKVLANPDAENVRRCISDVLNNYGRLSAGRLVDISHAPRGPWHTIVARAETSVALGLRIPDSITMECFKYQKVFVGPEPLFGDLTEEEPLCGYAESSQTQISSGSQGGNVNKPRIPLQTTSESAIIRFARAPNTPNLRLVSGQTGDGNEVSPTT